MSQRLGVSQPPRAGSDYPFLGENAQLSERIVDLCVSYLPQLHSMPLSIDSESVSFDGDWPQLQIRDAAGNLVFDTDAAQPVHRRDWGEHYRVHHWQLDEQLLTVILLRNSTTTPTPSQVATIDPRACVPLLPTLTQLDLVDRRTDLRVRHAFGPERLQLLGGFNQDLQVQPPADRTGSGRRLASRLQLAAIPGAGQGRQNNCQGTEAIPVLRTINQVGSDDGQLWLHGDPCIRVTTTLDPATQQPVDHTLTLSDNCRACCDCDDYLPLARGLVQLTHRMAFLEQVSGDLRAQLTDAVTSAQERLACQLQPLQLRVSGHGNCGLAIVAGYYNTAVTQQSEVVLELRIYRVADPDAETPTWIPAELSGFPPTIDLYSRSQVIASVRPSQLDKHRLRMSVGCVDPKEAKSVVLTPWVQHDGPHLICLTRIPTALKSHYTEDDIAELTESACVTYRVRCEASATEVAQHLLRLATRT